jgi:Tol biopolymer transport system component
MVSPSYKEGFAVDPSGFSGFTDDGIVSYDSFGNFAGNPQGNVPGNYHAARSAAGWMTSALAPPDLLWNADGNPASAESVDLRRSLWRLSRRNVPGDKTGFYLRDADGGFTRVGDAEDAEFGGRMPVGASADLSHLVFNHGVNGGAATDLYEYVGTGNGPVARAVSVDNLGQPTLREVCAEDVDVSADGRVIVYAAACRTGNSQVWARVAGSASVEVSGSECTRGPSDPGGVCGGDPAALYAGGAEDGSRVFLTTSRQLVNGDTDTGNDLYACDIPAGVPVPVGVANPCAPLVQVSGTASDARVERVGPVSEDGSRVYFVAQGVLADNLGVGDVGPATGAHNLYMWERDGAHPAGATRFVARLDNDDLGRGRMTPDGRYLVFVTTSKLVGAGPGADTDGAADAYRYDAVTRAIVRVSTSVSGSGGNDPAGFDVSLARQSSMSADGSTVIFDTDEALSGSDVDGVTDVYAWHDGHVSLISAGGGNAMGITASGRDIFFLSDKQVLASDGDFNLDVYDARVGGGFALTQTSPCSGDGCQGLRSLPPSLTGPLAPATGSGGAATPPPAFSLRVVSASQRKRLATMGTVSLTVTANAPGTVSVTATATIAGRSVTVGSARRSLTVPGRVVVPLSLSKRARSQLKARGRLTVRVAVSHSKVALDRSVTLKLVRAKAKAKRSLTRLSAHRDVGGGRS